MNSLRVQKRKCEAQDEQPRAAEVKVCVVQASLWVQKRKCVVQDDE